MRASWDIFCRVVDNYGDIGVSWRLARQLVVEHGQSVRLWGDDLAAFARICPTADVQAPHQWQFGVEVCRWSFDWQPVEVADVVLEAFACELPPAYLAGMRARPRQPLWLNLEYLSAEAWVGGCHGLPSLLSGGLRKFFFFPGFRPDTGGLLRERGLLQRRQAFQDSPLARHEFLSRLGVQPAVGEHIYSLFTYESDSLPGWLQALADGRQAVLLLVPEGRALSQVRAWLGEGAAMASDTFIRGRMRLQVLPFVSQEDYDRLLWSCDFNAVRGEDSFVRALWAGRPLLWHLYPQADEAHLHKLEAFLEIYLPGLPVLVAEAIGRFWRDWNQGRPSHDSWAELLKQWPQWPVHAGQFAADQAAREDLATGLAHFCANWL